MRGGAATWPSLAAVAVCGGVQNAISRRAWGARPGRGHLPLATGPRKKEFFLFTMRKTLGCLMVCVMLGAAGVRVNLDDRHNACRLRSHKS